MKEHPFIVGYVVLGFLAMLGVTLYTSGWFEELRAWLWRKRSQKRIRFNYRR